MADDDRPLFWQVARPLPQPRSFAGPVVPPGEALAYVRAAFTYEVERVRSAVIGTRNDTLNVAAFNLGQLVGSSHLHEPDVFQALYDAALSTGLTEREASATLSSGLRAGRAEPRDVPERPPEPARGPQSGPEDSSGASPPPGDGTEGEADPSAWLRDRFPVVCWPDRWDRSVDDEEWVLYPIIPARRIVALFSPPKLGKSLLLLEVAAAISMGRKALGHITDRPRRVLYVDFENDIDGDVIPRLKAMGFKAADLTGLDYMSFPPLSALDSREGGMELHANAVEHGSEVVVIDTISRAVRGEENDNDTWLQFYRHTGQVLKSSGITTVRLDHTGKDLSKGMRGGSAKYGDVDVAWSMLSAGSGEHAFKLECVANRLPIPDRIVLIEREVGPPLRHRVTSKQIGDVQYQEAVALIKVWDAKGIPNHKTGHADHVGRVEMRAVLDAEGVEATERVMRKAIQMREEGLDAFEPETDSWTPWSSSEGADS